MRLNHFLLAFVLLSNRAVLLAQNAVPQVSLPEPSFHFEITGMSEPVEHIFTFRNNTAEILESASLSVTPPLAVLNLSKRVPPGEQGILRFQLGEPRPVGDYKGLIEVGFTNKGVSNVTFEVTGKVTPLIETKPFPAFFVATGRDQPKEASLQLINHDAQPLEIISLESPSGRFSLRLETNQPGQVYTLFLKLPGLGKPGRVAEPITLRTSNKKEPAVLISANTYIHERVHTFPEDLDFGTMDGAAVKTNETLRTTLKQVLMVYQDGGTNLQVAAKTDLPFLSTRVEPSPTGKQVQIEVALNAHDLPAGDFQGNLELLTNDREFPKLEIKLKGQVR
jgi:hypothetical protein